MSPHSAHHLTQVRLVANAAERAEHFRIRHETFVVDQGLFVDDDRDLWDASAFHAIALHDGEIIGVVRFYPLDEAGLWQGDRLAVSRGARLLRAGPALVRFAVSTAGELGGHLMLARVQKSNVNFFDRLGWSTVGGLVDYRSHPHQRMTIPLAGAAQRPVANDLRWALGA